MVLPSFDNDLSAYALKALERLGVEVELGVPVSECTAEGVVYGDRKPLPPPSPGQLGVQASPAAQWLGAAADRAGRVIVEPDLTIPGHQEIFVIGDTAAVSDPEGKPVPGIAPAAKQQGRYVADTIRGRLRNEQVLPFRYKHDGALATIGKRLAVIDFGWIKLRGGIAWRIWGLAHIYFLIGVRNRLSVALNWLWIHSRDQRSSRLITQGNAAPALFPDRSGVLIGFFH